MPKQLLSRILRWLRKPSSERNRLIVEKLQSFPAITFLFGKSYFQKVYIAYQPDSHNSFKNHPEFFDLHDQFIKFNKTNNAGDLGRLWSLILNIKQVIKEGIQGEFAELGVWRGNTAAILAHYASTCNRKVYLFDTYEGFNNQDLAGIDSDKPIAFDDTSLGLVKEVIGKNVDVCEFVKGHFPGSITEVHKSARYSVVSLDCDLYEPMKASLAFFYPRLSKGGILLIHDYSSLFWEGAKKATDDFCQENNEYVVLLPDKSGSAFIRKSTNCISS